MEEEVGFVLVRSHLTAIACFAYRFSIFSKSTPASARSRNPHIYVSHPHTRKIKTDQTNVCPFLLGGGGIRTHGTLVTYDGFQDRSDKPLWHSSECTDYQNTCILT